jgi:sugar-specific transcriptional regulator TrmB
MIEKIIENFNLGEREAKVYLAALSLGKSRVSDIAKKARLNRITTYEILKRLTNKGIANNIIYKKIIYFEVIDPKQFLHKIERQAELAREAIPQLLLLKNTSNKQPRVEYFVGVEGLKVLYEDSLNCKNKIIYNMANIKNLINFFGKDFLNTYIKKRIRKEIQIKVLIPNDEIAKKYIENEKKRNSLREYKFFNNKKFPMPNEIMIYDNKIVLLSFSSQIGVIIEDNNIAKSLKSICRLLWEKL